jgi:threonine dehydrogenase-like Zn-dependent dehydrogenase
MGLAGIDYILNCDRRPAKLAVTDINNERLERAASILSPEYAKARGVELIYMNTAEVENATEKLKEFSIDGKGFDDVLVFAPVAPVIEMGDALLGEDGCLNFFAGPSKSDFSAKFNFYNVHYASTHIVGTSGGNTDDMRECLAMMAEGKINPAILVTHIGGIDSVIDATMNLPTIPGAKKLIYTGIEMPLTAIADFEEKGKTDPLFAELDRICKAHNNLWSAEAERYLLANA